jgi:hypothetical protein
VGTGEGGMLVEGGWHFVLYLICARDVSCD